MEPSEYRWLVPDADAGRRDDKTYWEAEHRDRQYESTFSVGEDAGLMQAIIDEALMASPCREILIVGCGSRIDLQSTLLERAPADTNITAIDFAAVIALARERFSHPRLTYVALEDTRSFIDEFDVVIAVNVLVMDSDAANRELVHAWARALNEQGRLVILAPLIFCGQDLALLSGRSDLWDCLDLDRSSWTEKRQGTQQIEYSPLRMRRILTEAGLRLTSLRVVFLDGPSSREEARRSYDLSDEDLLIYEQLVVARRDRI
jgi:SAM-dependent methyltransferase